MHSSLRGITLLSCLALATVGAACSSGSSDGTRESEDQLRASEQGFEYSCQAPPGGSFIIGRDTSKLVITKNYLRYEDRFGENLGTHDAKYRAPKGKARVRYKGFEHGLDCGILVVADQALLEGKASGELRVQCSGEGFLQNIFHCSDPKATTLRVPQQEPAPDGGTLPADTREWACNTTGSSVLGNTLSMQVVDRSMLVTLADDNELVGERNDAYRPRTGSWIKYDTSDYGGDCALSFVLDPKVLEPATTETMLKVRCAGDSFQEDRYSCSAQ